MGFTGIVGSLDFILGIKGSQCRLEAGGRDTKEKDAQCALEEKQK